MDFEIFFYGFWDFFLFLKYFYILDFWGFGVFFIGFSDFFVLVRIFFNIFGFFKIRYGDFFADFREGVRRFFELRTIWVVPLT